MYIKLNCHIVKYFLYSQDVVITYRGLRQCVATIVMPTVNYRP